MSHVDCKSHGQASQWGSRWPQGKDTGKCKKQNPNPLGLLMFQSFMWECLVKNLGRRWSPAVTNDLWVDENSVPWWLKHSHTWKQNDCLRCHLGLWLHGLGITFSYYTRVTRWMYMFIVVVYYGPISPSYNGPILITDILNGLIWSSILAPYMVYIYFSVYLAALGG